MITIDSATLQGSYLPAIVVQIEAPERYRSQLEGLVQRLVNSPSQAARTASIPAEVERVRAEAERLLAEAETANTRYLDGASHLLHAACERLYGSIDAAYVDGRILS